MNAAEASKATEGFPHGGRVPLRRDYELSPLTPRVPLDVDLFRRANPSGRITVPVTDPYAVTASESEQEAFPASDATVMPGLPDWPIGTTLGYPFTDTMEDPAVQSQAVDADSDVPAESSTSDEAATAEKPAEARETQSAAVVGESVTVIGNLVADPRLKELGKGSVVANFTIASTPRIYDEVTRQWKDRETVFHRASAWNATARHAQASLRKGSRIIAVGKFKSRTFLGKDGQPKTLTELVVDDLAVSLKFEAVTVDRDQRGRQEDRAAG